MGAVARPRSPSRTGRQVMIDCQHEEITRTKERGVYCCKCNEPLVSFFWPVSRNTPAGQVLAALRNLPTNGDAP